MFFGLSFDVVLVLCSVIFRLCAYCVCGGPISHMVYVWRYAGTSEGSDLFLVEKLDFFVINAALPLSCRVQFTVIANKIGYFADFACASKVLHRNDYPLIN